MAEKCPYCGNWNSKEAFCCGFCQKELPTQQKTQLFLNISPESLRKAVLKEEREKNMKEKEEKAPRTAEKDKYICPGCLEETLIYNEEERLFICKCGRKYALKEYLG